MLLTIAEFLSGGARNVDQQFDAILAMQTLEAIADQLRKGIVSTQPSAGYAPAAISGNHAGGMRRRKAPHR